MSINSKRCEIEGSLVHPLISAVTSHGSPSPEPGSRLAPKFPWFLPRSRGALLILLWNAVVGFTYAVIILTALAMPVTIVSLSPFAKLVYFFMGAYTAIAFIQMFYPVGGLIADLRCGRYRTVWCSMGSIWAGYVLLSCMAIAYLSGRVNLHHHVHPIMWLLGGIMGLLLVTGFTGFQANAVQFGLDQLLDVPSTELSVFLHWYVWMDAVGTFVARILGVAIVCSNPFSGLMSYSPFPILAIITALVVFSYWKRAWLHSEPRTHNPYAMVYRILRFVASHNKPLGPRTAFAYCDDEMPTRMEFAKQRFGGPFTTETVEDVKTFLRILVMLLAVGPVFALHVPTIYVFPLFGAHIGRNKSISYDCTVDWVLVQSNNLSYAFTIVLMPVYIIFVQPCAMKCLPRILYRLGFGITLLVASVLSMLAIDGMAHYHAKTHSISNTSCLFTEEYREKNFSQTLQFYTPVLIIPNLLTGIGVPVIFTTILEFISAQSPHTMKGLLLGVYYAIRGFFIILGCAIVLPFAQDSLWGDCTDKVLNCGFYYYLVNSAYGIISLILFWVAAKWYQYRVREDRPYDPIYVENYYARYAIGATALVSSPDEREGEGLLSQSYPKYGTASATDN